MNQKKGKKNNPQVAKGSNTNPTQANNRYVAKEVKIKEQKQEADITTKQAIKVLADKGKEKVKTVVKKVKSKTTSNKKTPDFEKVLSDGMKKNQKDITKMSKQLEEIKAVLTEKPKKQRKKKQVSSKKNAVGSTGEDNNTGLLVFAGIGGIGFLIWKSYSKKKNESNQLAQSLQQATQQQKLYQYYLQNGYTKQEIDNLISQGYTLAEPSPNGDMMIR